MQLNNNNASNPHDHPELDKQVAMCNAVKKA